MSLIEQLEQSFGELAEPLARLVLLRCEEDPRAMQRTLRKHVTARQALAERPVPADEERQRLWKALERDLNLLAKGFYQILLPTDPGWPSQLATCPHPPDLLTVRGELPDFERSPGLALVGSREDAEYGVRIGAHLAQSWARYGGVVVSGGARGVDAACHQACLEAGQPTIAVLATGVNRLYPARNRKLLQQVASQGAIVSEWPLDGPPLRHNFPWRNRLIAALSSAVVVVQARTKSGALHTASFALQCGRLLFTVPAPVDDEACRGGVELLRKGVPAMTGAEQLAELFAKVSGRVVSPLSSPERKVVEVEVEKVETKVSKVLAELARGASHVDELAINLNMGQAMLSMVLLDLELKHWVTREAGNHFSSNVRLKR